MTSDATERTPLRSGENVPPYVFITNHNRAYRNKIRKFQCCMCAGLLAILITALVVTVSYTVNHDIEDENGTFTEQTPSPSSFDSQLPILLTRSWPLPDQQVPSWDEVPTPQEIDAALAEGKKTLLLKEAFEEKVPSLPKDSPSFRHQLVTRTSPEARELARSGFIMEAATKQLVKNRTKSGNKFKPSRGPQAPPAEWLPKDICKSSPAFECKKSQYRTADGSCNNINHPSTFGVAMRPFRRHLPADYADGISAPRKAKDGSKLPPAREVSLTINRPLYRDDPNFTVMLAVWGQFIDHDITATALSQGKGGNAISCCNGYFQSGIKVHPECYTVTLDDPDPYYTQYNVTCMEFVRSSPAPTCSFGPREQLNQATSFLDGSVVYGTSDKLMNQLRSYEGGELKMLVTPNGDELLPVSTDSNDGCNQDEELSKGRYCFLSGDARANENIHLVTMHLLLARQHNLIARKLASLNPEWDDEKLFQESRKIVSAQMQHITYNEFLPVILGPRLMEKLKMSPRSAEEYSKEYDPDLDSSIANEFAASAFRFGHTLLPGLVKMIGGDYKSEEYVEMHRMLFNPFQLYDQGFIEKAVRGVINTPVERVDTYFNSQFTEHLFERKPSIGRPKGLCGLDLVSLNVQRGRDHGLRGYPDYREHCGLSRPKSFQDLKGIMDDGALTRIQAMYKTVDDVDMYSGALAEIPLEGGLVGPTITCLLTDQFLRLLRGDRFWYETDQKPQAFSLDQLRAIRKSSLAKMICDTSGVDKAQPQVMRKSEGDNQRKDCSELPALDLTPWQEKPRVKVDDDKPGKVWLIKSSAPKRPNVVKLGGIVKSGSITIQGSTIWSGTLPIRIPIQPFDAVSVKTDVLDIPYPPVFGHGILWDGKLVLSSGEAQLSGDISVPQYVHNSMGPLSINWYNGAFSLDISVAWNTSLVETQTLDGTYTTPVYFHDTYQLNYLKNESVAEVSAASSFADVPTVGENGTVAPLILLGSFTDFGKTFLWNGNVTLIIPQTNDETGADPNLLKLAYTPKRYTKHVKIGGRVSSASVSAQGYNLWSGNLPLAIPVSPFDSVAGPDSSAANDEPTIYGNGVNWKGTLTTTSAQTGAASASFSLPKYVHSNGIKPFAIQWYNGDLSVDFDVSWWSTCDGALDFDGTYTSQVFFSERSQYWYLKNSTYDASLIGKDIGFAGSPKQFTQGLKAPLILLGTYSKDRQVFLWSGNFTVILPQVVSIADQLLLKSASLPTQKKRVPLRLVGGQINVGGWNVWYNSLPVGIPTKPFDAVASPDGTDEPYDRPTLFGHGILWNGSNTVIDSNYIKIHGSYSFPQFVHSNQKTNNVSLTWLNGNFDLQFQYNTSFQISGAYTTPVYLAERPTFETLNEVTVGHASDLTGLGITKTSVPKNLDGDPESYLTAPLILFGIYSRDSGRSEFLWSGQCVLLVPTTNTTKDSTTILLKESSKPLTSSSEGIKIGGVAKSLEISINGVKLRSAQKPPLAISTSLFSSVSTSMSKADEPAGYANGVLWSGQLNFSSSTVTGSFSLPSTTEDGSTAWYNGNFSFSFDITWASSNATFDGVFSSPIYFQEGGSSSIKTGSQLPSSNFNTSAVPSIEPGVVESSPVILKGEYSADKAVFYWSGEFTIIIPPRLKALSAEAVVEPGKRQVFKAFVNGGSITSATSATLWLGNRVPLSLPVQQPYDSKVPSFQNPSLNPPLNVHGITWQGYISSDVPNTVKIWGAYSYPRYLHGNNTESSINVKLDWFNGNFAFDLKLLFGMTADVHLNGTYKTQIRFEEQSKYDGLTSNWSLNFDDSSSSDTPTVSPLDATSYVPVILHGSYSKDRKAFVWSGNVTVIIYE